MLLRGSSTRGARGQSSNRSRGSRGSRGGHGSSRGASSSSTPNAGSPNAFERERLENAAKREQRGRGQNGATVSGRGTKYANNQVRFNDSHSTEGNDNATKKNSTPPAMNPFASANASPFGAPSAPSFNPFAPIGKAPIPSPQTSTTTNFGKPAPSTLNPFAQPFPRSDTMKQTPSVFGAPSALASNPFGAPSELSSVPFGGAQNPTPGTSSSIFGSHSQPAGIFGAPSKSLASNPFEGFQPSAKSSNGSSFMSAAPPSYATSTAYSQNAGSSVAHASAASSATDSNPFGSFNTAHMPSTPSGSFSNSQSTAFAPPPSVSSPLFSHETKPAPKSSLSTKPPSSTVLSTKIDQLLRKEGIIAPAWPTSKPGDPKQKAAVEAFWQTSKKYRQRVRTTLIRAGLLDDPEKPKKLSEAIDFKGTCEDMCPEFEKITRIMEHDVREPEKESSPDGSLWPSPPKMIKALARSAAGQDAPLPMDVRSPAALRKTLDYLLQTVLGNQEGRLPAVHGFLWDRTRAIRRDFVFQSSMSPTELSDQVYCLERITRFHVIALHQMSMEGIEAEDFSEQQEVEQLGKSLLSLIHAYEDCQAQNLHCENEPEFRAYYILFNSHNTGILETVQDWGWRFWGESEEIKIAVSLVETLQNVWDTRGPLKPHSATDIAQNAFSRFFSIVDDRKISYTMACFAEIHFNSLRKSALKAIFAAYRLPRAPTKDWTLSRLNDYLWFDDEQDVVPFAEAYGLSFEENADEEYLSFEADGTISDPFPPLKQRHSDSLVERKRGDYSLPEVIDRTVYDESEASGREGDVVAKSDEEGLFVTADNNVGKELGPTALLALKSTHGNNNEEHQISEKVKPTLLPEAVNFKRSVFDQVPTQKAFSVDFFSQKGPETSPPVQANGLPSSTSTVEITSHITSAFGHPPTQAHGQSKEPLLSFPKPTSVPNPGQISKLSSDLNITSDSHPQSLNFGLKLGSHSVTNSQFDTPKSSLNLGSHVSTTPSDTPKSQFSLGSDAASERSKHAKVISPGTDSQTALQQQGIAQFQFPTPPQFAGPTIATTLAPAPHTMSQSQTSSLVPSSSSHGLAEAQTTVLPASRIDTSTSHSTRMDGFSKWVACGDGGLVDQYIEFTVEKLLREAVEVYIKDETRKATIKAEEAARKEADSFRLRFLATKYGKKWRSLAHLLWLRRKGRNAREARKQYAESLRASKLAQSANIVKDFKASAKKVRRASLESLLDAGGVLNVDDPRVEIRAVPKNDVKPSKKRRVLQQSTNSLALKSSTHKRGKSENPLRRSMLSDPCYLNGGSRIHLMSNYTAQDEGRKQVSGVRTDYFRLKARGITTLPDGTPLASSVANNITHKKRSYDDLTNISTPASSRMQEIPRSEPVHARSRRDGPRTTIEREEDIQALKSRAKDIIAADSSARERSSKRSFGGDDEELFERAKRVREQLDEGAGWYRKQIEEGTDSRSMS